MYFLISCSWKLFFASTVVNVTMRVGTLSIWRGASHMWYMSKDFLGFIHSVLKGNIVGNLWFGYNCQFYTQITQNWENLVISGLFKWHKFTSYPSHSAIYCVYWAKITNLSWNIIKWYFFKDFDFDSLYPHEPMWCSEQLNWFLAPEIIEKMSNTKKISTYAALLLFFSLQKIHCVYIALRTCILMSSILTVVELNAVCKQRFRFANFWHENCFPFFQLVFFAKVLVIEYPLFVNRQKWHYN